MLKSSKKFCELFLYIWEFFLNNIYKFDFLSFLEVFILTSSIKETKS